MKKVFFLGIILMMFGQNGLAQSTANDFYIKGIQSFDQGKTNEALAYFNQAIKLNPEFSEAFLKRGACFMLFHDYVKAIQDFDKVIALNPANELAYFNRGVAYRSVGMPTKAVIDFTKVIELNPDFGLAFFNRALSKMRLDDFVGACPDLSKAADLGVKGAHELYKYNCLN